MCVLSESVAHRRINAETQQVAPPQSCMEKSSCTDSCGADSKCFIEKFMLLAFKSQTNISNYTKCGHNWLHELLYMLKGLPNMSDAQVK